MLYLSSYPALPIELSCSTYRVILLYLSSYPALPIELSCFTYRVILLYLSSYPALPIELSCSTYRVILLYLSSYPALPIELSCSAYRVILLYLSSYPALPIELSCYCIFHKHFNSHKNDAEYRNPISKIFSNASHQSECCAELLEILTKNTVLVSNGVCQLNSRSRPSSVSKIGFTPLPNREMLFFSAFTASDCSFCEYNSNDGIYRSREIMCEATSKSRECGG